MKGGETGAIIVPGNSEQSLIVRRVLGLDGDDRMPKDGDPLPAAQIALIRAWIDQGAAWPDTATGAGTRRSAEPDEPRSTGRIAAPSRPALPDVRTAGLGAHADRSFRPGAAREGRAGAVARGAARDPRAPRRRSI